MLKGIMIAAVAAVSLSGCAASSLEDIDAGNTTVSQRSSVKQQVTGSVTPTSADASVGGDAPVSLQARDASKVLPPEDAAAVRATAAAVSASATPGSAAYKIGPHDVLDVTVFKVAELSKTAQVSEAGTINYPLVGDVVAAGKTPRQVEQELASQLGAKYLQKPQVSVFVKEYNSQRITIEGAIKRPGVLPVQGSLTLLQAVALSGGMDVNADDTVVVFRQVNGKRTAARFDVAAIKTGDAEDPQLQAGDVVIAGTSALKEGWSNIMKVLPVTSMFALI